MESVINEISEKCKKQLKAFAKCVDKHPNSYDCDCKKQKEAVQRCSEENSKLLKLINKHCKQQSIAYDTCVNNNKLNPESQCLKQFRALYLCSQVIQEGAKAGEQLRRIERRTRKSKV
ncbi:hypothetical protein H8356DRAFT_990404 [Neocallimastix lanati (nom. inval.)]|uniref:IMS import disulfide relay-system CHCH-CHCH-like Cx9C domain-containing protein n=1 Tax=Neocallimastix californiae TaxID=1754190 RepID=A0A1Y2CLP5_9FUNG|nr:hypothetical protein H8356DRAFT_990404 [Neocallimastix sp. JGI-2020a]ORY47930.1 hypothetical protein LY90DRAFT_671083 [Neocallimastix californiae]|eukprot:ORY47930.1 hypothetical protein LY90DRAFT_671083 [Neocallimastix californiae]